MKNKKTFGLTANSVLDGLVQKKTAAPAQPLTTRRGRPKTNFKLVATSKERGTKEGEERTTVILKTELINKMKAIAYWERLLVKDVFQAALEEHLAKYERKNGTIKTIPSKK